MLFTKQGHRLYSTLIKWTFWSYKNEHKGPVTVVRKPISANPGLNFAQGFWFSCLKALLLLIISYSLKAAKANLLRENNVLESASLWIKSDFKNRTNPGLA